MFIKMYLQLITSSTFIYISITKSKFSIAKAQVRFVIMFLLNLNMCITQCVNTTNTIFPDTSPTCLTTNKLVRTTILISMYCKCVQNCEFTSINSPTVLEMVRYNDSQVGYDGSHNICRPFFFQFVLGNK